MGAGSGEQTLGRASHVCGHMGCIENGLPALSWWLPSALSFYSVAARYVFHVSLDWSDEISIYRGHLVNLLRDSSLIKKDEHVRVDVLLQRLSPKRQNVLHFYHGLLGLAFVCIMIYGGVLMIQKAAASGITSESHSSSLSTTPTSSCLSAAFSSRCAWSSRARDDRQAAQGSRFSGRSR